MAKIQSWDISNKYHTQTKLEIISQAIEMWLTIWNKQADKGNPYRWAKTN